jgi:dolichol-phosphate mannosyltransferase
VSSDSLLLVIPTYQESENVKALLSEILNSSLSYTVLFIDDSSPDGTGNVVLDAAKVNSRVRLISRSKRMGVASAFLLGLRFAIDHQFDWVACMDADQSHKLQDLDLMIKKKLNSDISLYIGSRYIEGGKVLGVPKSRRILSIFGNLLARRALLTETRDVTGGFRIYNVSSLSNLEFENLSLGGYGFQLQILKYFLTLDSQIVEFPIEFKARVYGSSKMKVKTVVEVLSVALKLGFQIRIRRWFRR